MSIKVSHLTKIYGTQKAVDDVSFEVGKGEIIGFLGPNGAGKSTTMKIISCYLPPTSGSAEVCGYDVLKDPLEVRKRIGYLPEHNPLYKEMYVKEYLTFIGKVHNLGSELKSRISEMIEMTGLSREQNKKIRQLSKGYRQRVGLAHAMIHNPEVLILDEPTTGLDPNQLVEIRELIKNLGKEKTLIFSSHILQEVQAVADRILIIDKGKLVADDDKDVLTQTKQKGNVYILEFQDTVKKSMLTEMPHVERVDTVDNKNYRLYTQSEEDLRAKLFKWAAEKDLTLLTLKKESVDLEDIFKELTK